MKIAMVTASISRFGGGVSGAVRRLSQTLLAKPGVDVEVFGLRDESTTEDLSAWWPVRTSLSDIKGPSSFGYAPALAKALGEAHPDVIHGHGLWMYPGLVARRWQRRFETPSLVSPHGMLDSWALRNSHWKKRLAAILFENDRLEKAACIQALSESEAQAVRRYGLRNPICVIPIGVDLPTEDLTNDEAPWGGVIEAGKKVLLYVGRLHRKKGLRELLHAWHLVKREDRAASNWVLAIVGWDQLGCEAELRRIKAILRLEDVYFCGPYYDLRKRAAMKAAHAFVLPSLSEGLPLAVLEAWAHGLPVVMTRECNLPEGFIRGAAIGVEPRAESISRGLSDLFATNEEELREMGSRGRGLVVQRFSWPRIAAETRVVYEWVLGGGARPACILSD